MIYLFSLRMLHMTTIKNKPFSDTEYRYNNVKFMRP